MDTSGKKGLVSLKNQKKTIKMKHPMPSVVNLGQNVIGIPNEAYCNKNIISVKFNKILKTIGNNAFEKNSITEVKIPDTVKKIGKLAFANNKLKKVYLPKELKIIGKDAFKNNSELEVVHMPSVFAANKYEIFDNNSKIKFVFY